MRVIGTWKNKVGYFESQELARQLAEWMPGHLGEVSLTVCPATLALADVRRILPTDVTVGAQNVIWDAPNSFTGETSAESLKEVGCEIVMVGHSERRTFLSETDEQVSLKTNTILEHGLTPLVCVGETYDERVGEQTAEVIERQLTSIVEILKSWPEKTVLIAYEPAWAITTNKQKLPANPQLAAVDHALIRGFLDSALPAAKGKIELIYGAGVNVSNVVDFITTENVDGVLVGGASQSFSSFTELIQRVVKQIS